MKRYRSPSRYIRKITETKDDSVKKRICNGIRAGSECNKLFQPNHKWNFRCEICEVFISRNNISED